MKEYNDFLKTKSHLSPHTLRSYANTMSAMMNHFGINDLSDYQRLSLLDFETFLSGMNVQNSSYNTHLRNLRVFSTWMKEHGLDDNNFPTLIKPRKEVAKEKIYLSEEERQSMIANAKSLDFKLSLALMLYMGLRREELIKIKAADIGDKYLMVKGKGNKNVKLEMPPIVKTLVDNYLKLRRSDSEYLLLSKVGAHPLANTGSIAKRVKSVAKKAGISEERLKMVAPHTLRRTFACLAVKNNVSPYIVKDMLRHSNFSTTERYLAPLGSEAANNAIANQPMPDAEAMAWTRI